MGAMRANDTYGSALEAQPGKSQGRPTTLTRARSATYKNGLPSRVRSQMPRDPDGRTVLTTPDAQTAARASRTAQQHLPPFIPDTNAIEALNRQLRKAVKTKGHFPTEDAARKLIYLAIQNAVPQWTRTRGWTKALLAFKIHFGDRLPD
jgi:hypothetical protein